MAKPRFDTHLSPKQNRMLAEGTEVINDFVDALNDLIDWREGLWDVNASQDDLLTNCIEAIDDVVKSTDSKELAHLETFLEIIRKYT